MHNGIVAVLAAALGMLASGAALASEAEYVPSEDDAILLQLQVKKFRLMNELRGYQMPEGVCVDLADVIQSLDIPVRLDKKSRRATGWLFAENQSFTLDRAAKTVQTMNMKRAIQPGELIDTPEGWCVDTRSLEGWLGVKMSPNLRDSTLQLESETPLPFMQAVERQSRAARLRPERNRVDFSLYPQADASYSMWRMPSVDVVARTDFSDGRGNARLNTRYEVFASGEIARASFDMRLASDNDGVPETLRMRAYRMDPDGRIFGPLRATQAVAGDVDMISGNLAGAAGAGRGAFLSNRAIDQSDRFGKTILRGTLPLGWDAELYRNGQLLAFQNDRPDGRYEFEVNLLYGSNDLEVVLYGPQGQVRREGKAIQVGFGTVPPGKLEYWAGFIERGHDLVSFGRPPPTGLNERGWQFAAGAQYGLDRRTVIGANAHSMYYDALRRDYLELNLQRALGPMLFNLSAAQEFGAGRAYRLDMIGKYAGINFQGQSLLVDGPFSSGLVDPLEKSSHSFGFDTTLRTGRTPIGLAGGIRRTERKDGRQVDEAQGRVSFLLPRVSLTGFVAYRDRSDAADPEDGTRIGLLANARVLDLNVRSEASYRIAGPRKGIDKLSLTVEKDISDRSEVRLDVERSMRRGITEFDLGLVRHFRKIDVNVGAHADTAGEYGANLALSFSFGRDPLSGRWRMSSEKLAQRGQAAVSVFLDEDGNGFRSADEKPLTGITVNAGFRGSSAPTDDLGRTIVDGLQPYQKVLVGIDESSLDDPFLVPNGGGIVVTPRPGVASVLEIAISPTGEVEGTINGPEGTPLAGVRLELKDRNGKVAAATMTEFDGFFLFDRVAYGSYQLEMAEGSEVALGIAGAVATGISLGPDQTVARLGTIRLRGAARIAGRTGARGARSD